MTLVLQRHLFEGMFSWSVVGEALEVFTDREHEWSTVVDSVRNVHARVTGPGFDAEDLESPRRNVLTFYGVGGIGKTTLSRQVYDRLSDRDDDPPQCPWLVVLQRVYRHRDE
ncbi:NB-ARC domain-containing protein [Nocardia sp. NPDC047038]|uniref:NB-ARC domain-containing protein n=1 Tax=Nocardia sp. NPDC047038 TaxID=3154338 RepID=UPI0033D56C69